MKQTKNVNIVNFLFWGDNVCAKRGNGSEEIVGRWQNNGLCQKICLLGVICKVANIICLVKNFVFLKNICYQYLNFVLQVMFLSFYELLIGPQPTFLECIYNITRQLCPSGPSYSSPTVKIWWRRDFQQLNDNNGR